MEEYLCYRKVIIIFNLVYLLITLSSVATENNYFPDVPETSEFLKTINELIEERARQRFLEHWQKLQLNKNILPKANIGGSVFTYYNSDYNTDRNQNDPIDFAVGPNDLRFYDSIINTNTKPEDQFISEQELRLGNPNIILPPSPQDIKPKLPILLSLHSRRNNEQLSENLLPQHVIGVVQTPVEMDEAITMYIVALIGGISAAVTVGLISIMIGWYTLHKRAKAAAEVEYPAYGVTGPSKESSHSNDSRLAQSAQMYHYQHQKQQIIAMDLPCHTNNNTDHSNAESDEDNEERHYTVYECPGLAPTGEMEVKNPLFADDKPLHLEINTN